MNSTGQFEEGYFTFKRFRIRQQRSAMKVGTDAVLLGSWMKLPPEESSSDTGIQDLSACTKPLTLLDIGTGTGVISLFTAQRLADAGKPFLITAVEPDTPSCDEAAENFSASPWGDCLQAVNASLQEYAAHMAEGCMDMIFSNPPYFIDSLKAPDRRRCSARHTDSLPFVELVKISTRLLKEGGVLAVILPPEEAQFFIRDARGCCVEGKGLVLTRLCHVQSSAGKPVKRWIMEFTCASSSPINTPSPEAEVIILQDGVSRSAQYARLTADFYVR